MQIDVKSKDNGAILHLNGKVIGDSVSRLRQIIEDQIDSGVNWIIVDLAGVPLMDSSALGTIIAGFLKLRERNGKLVLLNVRENIRNVLAITKLDSLFEVYKDMEAALKSIGSGSVAS